MTRPADALELIARERDLAARRCAACLHFGLNSNARRWATAYSVLSDMAYAVSLEVLPLPVGVTVTGPIPGVDA